MYSAKAALTPGVACSKGTTLLFASWLISQARRQRGGRLLDPRFLEHAVMTTLNFDDIDFTGYYPGPAELPVKIPADWAEAASKE
jgi:hypothetical protein